MRTALINKLLNSPEPSIRWRTLVKVLGENSASAKIQKLQREIKESKRVKDLLGNRMRGAGFTSGRSIYAKWQGAHWVLIALADMGYPKADPAFRAMRDHVLDVWLNESFYREFVATSKAQVYRQEGVPVMNGRHRRCGSQQGAALLYLTVLGLANERAERLVERLLYWQWPDGGWNCDKNPSADTSSFMETLLPMRGLAAWASATGDRKARDAAVRAAEVLLERKLYKRRRDGSVIHPEFVLLHYPHYWHYDFLAGLKGLAEIGLTKDRRCIDALDLLEQKELPGGGWPAEKRYYRPSSSPGLHNDHVDWGGASRKQMNEWVTTDALYVLHAAGRA